MTDAQPIQTWTIHIHKRGLPWIDLPEPFTGTKDEVIAECARLNAEGQVAANATSIDEPDTPAPLAP